MNDAVENFNLIGTDEEHLTYARAYAEWYASKPRWRPEPQPNAIQQRIINNLIGYDDDGALKHHE